MQPLAENAEICRRVMDVSGKAASPREMKAGGLMAQRENRSQRQSWIRRPPAPSENRLLVLIADLGFCTAVAKNFLMHARSAPDVTPRVSSLSFLDLALWSFARASAPLDVGCNSSRNSYMR